MSPPTRIWHLLWRGSYVFARQTDDFFRLGPANTRNQQKLACEGFRHHDFRRWAAHSLFKDKLPQGYPFDQQEWGEQAISIPRDANGFLNPLGGNLGTAGWGFKPERDYLDGVPVNEITINPNLKQNPGWN